MDEVASWRRTTAGLAGVLLVAAIGCLFIRGNSVTLHLAKVQDAPVLIVLAVSVGGALLYSPRWRLPSRLPPLRTLLLAGAAITALLAWGTYAIFGNYPLSRDEHMVLFDMRVFATGHLAMPLAPFWRPYAAALVPDYLINERMPTGLVSGYLPMNAMLRLLLATIVNPVWFNPLLALAGGVALLSIAVRVFGKHDRTCWVVALVYAFSTQLLVMAMTPFSMTGHMALNLIWLAAFMRGGKAGNAAAILAGFVAVGLHQLVFHPLFIAPFLLWRLLEGKWRTIILYGLAYSLIIAWWAYYPILASSEAVTVPGTSTFGEGPHTHFIADKVMPLLFHRTPGTTGLMVLNMLRFFAWQNFALLPLLVVAVPVAMREGGFARALLLGIAVWLAFLTFIIPYQGLGWGYRYLTPYLGSFALLAGYGYRDIKTRLGARSDGLVLLLTGATTIVALPIMLVTTHRFARPYLELEHLIARQSGAFVVIDTAVSNPPDESWALHPLDQVRNQPDLSNHPLRFSGNRVDSELVSRLCEKGQVTFITRADMHRVGFMLNVPRPSPRFEEMVRKVDLKEPGCLRNPN